MRAAFLWYDSWMHRKPLLTKSITSFFIQSAGDMLAQYFEHKSIKDYKRVVIQGLFGTFYVAPSLHVWLGFLAQRYPQKGAYTVFKKVVIHMTVFSFFINSSFLFVIAALNDLSIHKGVETVQAKLSDSMIAGFYFWPFVQTINFSIVPTHYQAISTNFASIFWSAYLSHKRATNN